MGNKPLSMGNEPSHMGAAHHYGGIDPYRFFGRLGEDSVVG
jgi:hypothetical protein